MPPLVAVVDDDLAVRESLESLIRSVGSVRVPLWRTDLAASCRDCLVFDVRLPGMSGIDLPSGGPAMSCPSSS
jgi:FixJ family two-component response regulator